MLAFSTPPGPALDSRGGRCMYEQVDRLRAAGTAVPVRLPEGAAAWSVTRGDVARRLLAHPAVTRDPRKSVPDYRPGLVPWLSPWVDVVSMSTTDGREHARLRKLVTPAFTPRRVNAMRPQVEAVVTGLLDALAAKPADQPVDLHAAFCYPVPTEMICDLFGVPAEQRAEVLRILRVVVHTGEVSEEESLALNDDMVVAMRVLIDTKRRAPGEDLTSFLIATREQDEDPLTEHELISTLLLMLGGGSSTTIALLDHAVRELLGHPEQLRTVRDDPAHWPDVIEEALRVHCPVMHLPMRWATEDIDLGEGVVIRSGDAIMVAWGAHGRDPALHDDPGVFDIDRENKEHLAFGLGAHFCPGARLARLEAEVALPALFERFPRLALATAPDEIEPVPSFIGNYITALPVLLDHRAAP